MECDFCFQEECQCDSYYESVFAENRGEAVE